MHYCLFVLGDDPEFQLEPYYQESFQLVRGRPILEIAEEAGVENLQGDILKQLKELTLESWVGATAILAHDYQEGLLEDLVKAGIDHFVMLGEDRQFHALNRLVNEGCKWDWYEIGGRWRNLLKAKPGYTGEYRQSPFTALPMPPDESSDARKVWHSTVAMLRAEASERKPEHYDILPVEGIDWEGTINREYVEDALTNYDRTHQIVAGREWQQWPDYYAANRSINVRMHSEEFDSLRKKYNKLPVIADLLAGNAVSWQSLTDPIFLLPRDEFLEIVKLRTWLPYAILINGQWYERDDDVMAIKEWAVVVKRHLDNADPKTRLTVVDCHS